MNERKKYRVDRPGRTRKSRVYFVQGSMIVEVASCIKDGDARLIAKLLNDHEDSTQPQEVQK